MEYWTILLSIVVLSIGILSLHYLYQKFNYFKRHGVLHIPSLPIFDNNMLLILRRLSFADFLQKLYYFNPDAKYCGFYITTRPMILLRDPEVIRDVCIKSFDVFPNRLGFIDFNDILFSKNIFSIRGQKWRDVRTLLSPSFTSSKMKTMFTLMSECAVDFTKSLSEILRDKSDMDMKELFTKYTTDVIASCAFGIKVDSMKNPTNEFYFYGTEAANFFRKNVLQFFFFRTFPKLAQFLGLRFLSDGASRFFKDTIKTTIDMRDAKNITRPDMLQLMMDKRGENKRQLDIDDITAQAFFFFLTGFEISSNAMCFIAHEIAANPDIQTKLRQEFDQILKDSNGNVTCDAINQLKYLDMVISESLRLYPPVMFVERECDKAYELPPALPNEKPVIIQKGQLVWIPIHSIHCDEKYYDEPEKFRPERFSTMSSHHKSSYYMPFGIGPRMCIASRFALLELKILVFHLLARCELKPCAKTMLPMKFSKLGTRLMPENGFWLSVQRRSD
ncbi:Cytochrome P450 9e2, partial [Harpegnathos saltator]